MLALLVCAAPSLALAAGFAPSALFLSPSSPTEGDTVVIHAVVQNDSAAKFPGQLAIMDGEEKVGSVAAALAPGEVRAMSLSWKPTAGSHTITAQLVDAAGAVAQSESETFSIKAKPVPVPKATEGRQASSSNQVAAIESSDGIQDKIGSVSPAAENATAPAFKLIDGGRNAIADVLDTQLAHVKPKVAAPLPGVVAGAETIKAPDQEGWFWGMIYTVYYYILTVLRFLVGSAGIFYPLLAVVFFFILWKTFRRFRRA